MAFWCFILELNALRRRARTTKCETLQKKNLQSGLCMWAYERTQNCLHMLLFCQNCQFKTEEREGGSVERRGKQIEKIQVGERDGDR